MNNFEYFDNLDEMDTSLKDTLGGVQRPVTIWGPGGLSQSNKQLSGTHRVPENSTQFWCSSLEIATDATGKRLSLIRLSPTRSDTGGKSKLLPVLMTDWL